MKSLHRIWFYYRIGISHYIAMILQAINAIILIYFVAGDKIFLVRDVFPHLAYFTAFVIFVGFPLIVIIGKLHYRYAYKSESDIMMLKNPYIDKIELPLFNQLVIALLQEDPKNKELLKLHKLIQELKEGTNQLDN